MKVLDKIEKNINKAVDLVDFHIVYKPGYTEEFDRYKAHNKKYKIDSYGSSPAKAVKFARRSLKAYFLENYNEALMVLSKKSKNCLHCTGHYVRIQKLCYEEPWLYACSHI